MQDMHLFDEIPIFSVKRKDFIDISTTSKGNQEKWNTGEKFYKADSMGYEALSEVLVSLLEKYLNLEHVEYFFCKIRVNTNILCGCYSHNFLKDGENCISFAHLLEKEYFDLRKVLVGSFSEKFQFVIKKINEYTGLDCSEYLSNALYLDSIILNEDRHLNNLAVILGENNRISPIFDNGLSLLSDTLDYPIDVSIYDCMKQVKAKPFTKDFQKQVIALNAMGFPKLKLNYDDFQKELQSFQAPLYNNQIVSRAKGVLLNRLKKMEGLAWQRV